MRPRPVLEDMPYHVKKKIVEFVGRERTVLAFTSKKFEDLVIVSPSKLKVQLAFVPEKIVLTVWETQTVVVEEEEDSFDDKEKEEEGNDEKEPIEQESEGEIKQIQYEEQQHELYSVINQPELAAREFQNVISLGMTFKCLVIYIKYPEYRPEREEFEKDKNEFMGKVQNMLKSLKKPLDVKKVEIRCSGRQDDMLAFLPYINPKTLKSLKLSRTEPRVDETLLKFNEVMKLDLWKSTPKILCQFPFYKIPFYKWWNLTKFAVTVESITPADLLRITKHLAKSHTFIKGKLVTKLSEETIMKALAPRDRWSLEHDEYELFYDRPDKKKYMIILASYETVRFLSYDEYEKLLGTSVSFYV